MIDDQAYMTALMEGFWSGVNGTYPRPCPYPKMTQEWSEWMRWHEMGIRCSYGDPIDEPPMSGCIRSALGLTT